MGLKTVTHLKDTLPSIYFLVLFLSHTIPFFLGQHIFIANIVFLLQMWLQFLMYDACQSLSENITANILFITKI